MDIWDKSLHPSGFQAYELSRSILQEPCSLWSHPLDTAGHFQNGLLLTSDVQNGKKLVTCSANSLAWISLDDAETTEMELPVVGTTSWPQSYTSVDGCDWVVLRCGDQMHLASQRRVHTVQVPEAEEDPGDVLAASITSNNQWVAVLFEKKVNTAAVPLFGLTLGHLGPIDLTENNKEAVAGEPMRFKAAWSLLGAAPILGARLWCHGCGEETEVMVLSHGKYNFEGPSEAEAADRSPDIDEVDEELKEMMMQQGLQLPQLPKSKGASAVLTLASATAVQHLHLGLPAVTCPVDMCSPWPMGVDAMAVVLRTAQGHAAICQCWVVTAVNGSSTIKVQHIDTFPGLAVVCDTPGVAYLSVSDHWAAVGRWRSRETVEVFKHPKGQRRSVTRGLQLDGLRGLQIVGGHLFVWHSQGLLRYELQSQDLESSKMQPIPYDEWSEAPHADLSSDWETAWQQSN